MEDNNNDIKKILNYDVNKNLNKLSIDDILKEDLDIKKDSDYNSNKNTNTNIQSNNKSLDRLKSLFLGDMDNDSKVIKDIISNKKKNDKCNKHENNSNKILSGIGKSFLSMGGVSLSVLINYMIPNDYIRVGKIAIALPSRVFSSIGSEYSKGYITSFFDGLLDGMIYDSLYRGFYLLLHGNNYNNRGILDDIYDKFIGNRDVEGRLLTTVDEVSKKFADNLKGIADNLCSRMLCGGFISEQILFKYDDHNVNDESDILRLTHGVAYLYLYQEIETPTYIYPEIDIYYSADGNEWDFDSKITILNADKYMYLRLVPLGRDGYWKLVINHYREGDHLGVINDSLTKKFRVTAKIFGPGAY